MTISFYICKKGEPNSFKKEWALTGANGKKRNIIKSFYPVHGWFAIIKQPCGR